MKTFESADIPKQEGAHSQPTGAVTSLTLQGILGVRSRMHAENRMGTQTTYPITPIASNAPSAKNHTNFAQSPPPLIFGARTKPSRRNGTTAAQAIRRFGQINHALGAGALERVVNLTPARVLLSQFAIALTTGF
jgi:hypothetical protein